MIRKDNSDVRGLLMNVAKREAGEMIRDGKRIEWDTGDFITILPYEDIKGQSRKIRIHPASVKHFYDATDKLHWGALIKVTVEGKQAVGIDVEADLFADYCDFDL